MKFPIDPITFVETLNQVAEHERNQTLLIHKMAELLEAATDDEDLGDEPWYKESKTLLKDLETLRIYHESRRFNEANLRAQNPEKEGQIISAFEEPTGSGEMSEEELSRHLGQKPEKKKKEKPKQLEQMTLEEIESWEKQQENSNDIYKVKARVANLARGPGVSLTPQGEMLCNTYVHVLKALYDFADKLEDKNTKVQLIALIRSQEGMPGTLIAAAGAGVNMKDKNEKNKR